MSDCTKPWWNTADWVSAHYLAYHDEGTGGTFKNTADGSGMLFLHGLSANRTVQTRIRRERAVGNPE